MMPSMRTTVRIDDELLEALKEQARKEKISLTRLLDRTLRPACGVRGPAGRDAATANGRRRWACRG